MLGQTVEQFFSDNGYLPVQLSEDQIAALIQTVSDQSEQLSDLQQQITDLYSLIAYIFVFLVMIVIGKLFSSFFNGR